MLAIKHIGVHTTKRSSRILRIVALLVIYHCYLNHNTFLLVLKIITHFSLFYLTRLNKCVSQWPSWSSTCALPTHIYNLQSSSLGRFLIIVLHVFSLYTYTCIDGWDVCATSFPWWTSPCFSKIVHIFVLFHFLLLILLFIHFHFLKRAFNIVICYCFLLNPIVKMEFFCLIPLFSEQELFLYLPLT